VRRKGRQVEFGSALESLERRLDRTSGGRYVQVRVADAWEAVAGPTVADHTAGVFLRGGELVVQVDSSVWATELSALAGPYTEALNSHLGKDLVTTIRFTVSRRVKEARRHEEVQEEQDEFYAADPSRAVPLTEAERAQVEASAASIEDEELRKAVVKATIASMEWRKGLSEVKTRQEPRQGL